MLKEEIFLKLNDQSDRRSFDEIYMLPDPNRAKYSGRDKEIGKKEAERRRAVMPTLRQRSQEITAALNVSDPLLTEKGSTVVDMCTEESDLDVAVVVDQGHLFRTDPEAWKSYSSKLASTTADFPIKPHLIPSEVAMEATQSRFRKFERDLELRSESEISVNNV